MEWSIRTLNKNNMENGNRGAFAMLDSNGSYTQYGLTKREYFAAFAMQGLLANQNGGMQKGGGATFSPVGISELAVLHADATLAELEKTEKP
jgi:hypothetical protein